MEKSKRRPKIQGALFSMIAVFLTASLVIGCTPKDSSRASKTTATTLPATPVPPKVPRFGVITQTRILCQPNLMSLHRSLLSLTTNATEKTVPESFRLLDGETVLGNFETFHWLFGDGMTGEVVFSVREPTNQQAKIYWGQIDLISHQGIAQKISDEPVSHPLLAHDAKNLWQKPTLVGFHRDSAYLLIPENKQYVLKDLRSLESLATISLSPQIYWNPMLDVDGHRATFQSYSPHGLVRLKLVDIFSGQSQDITPYSKNADQILPELIGEDLYWIEIENDRIRLLRSSPNGDSRTTESLYSKDVSNLKALTWGLYKDNFYLFATQESYKNSRLVTGSVLVVQLPNLATKPKDENTFAYPPHWMGKSTADSPLLKMLRFSPWTQELVAAADVGLVSFSFTKNTWKFHSTGIKDFRCHDLEIGPEYLIKETP